MAYTAAQSKFIKSDAKFIRLLAPAGCGKTFSIVEKAKALFTDNKKVKISIFTFTKNAANEIKDRCDNDTCVSVFTLNSWGNNYIKTANVLKNPRILEGKDKKWYVMSSLQPVWSKSEHSAKFEGLLTGRSRVRNSEKILDMIDNFANIGFKHIYFTKDQKSNEKIYTEHLKFINKVSLSRYYSMIVKDLLSLIGKKEINKPEEEQHKFIIRHWIPFWRDCCEHMLKTGSYTFDGQKYFANIELEKKLAKNQKRTGATKIDYIFVDEFQDTSPLDLSMVSNLQKLTDSALVIVGDDDQAIYEFRGASPYFILNPDKIFGNKFKTFILDENFRSPKNIVDKSMLLIRHNENRVDKDVHPNSDRTANIQLKQPGAADVMVERVIKDIKKTLTETNKTIAILSRLKSTLLPYQILLTKENIPYSVSDDLAFFYTSAAASLNKVMDIKRNGQYSADDLAELVCLYSKNEMYKEAQETLFRAFRANYATTDKINKIMLYLGTNNPRFSNLFTHDYIAEFYDVLTQFQRARTVFETLSVLLTKFGGFQQNYSRSLEDLYYKDPPLSSLLTFASHYGDSFDGFVNDFNRAIDMAQMAAQSPELIMMDEKPRITLSTALRVKGQEYDKVIVIDVNDGVWPKQPMASQHIEEMESERRLFYVATTRAKQDLLLYRSTAIGRDRTTISPFVLEGEYDQ